MSLQSVIDSYYRLEHRLPKWARRAWPIYLLFLIVVAISFFSMLRMLQWRPELRIVSEPPPAASAPPAAGEKRKEDETLGRAVKIEGGQRKTYRAVERDGAIQIIVEKVEPVEPEQPK